MAKIHCQDHRHDHHPDRHNRKILERVRWNAIRRSNVGRKSLRKSLMGNERMVMSLFRDDRLSAGIERFLVFACLMHLQAEGQPEWSANDRKEAVFFFVVFSSNCASFTMALLALRPSPCECHKCLIKSKILWMNAANVVRERHHQTNYSNSPTRLLIQLFD